MQLLINKIKEELSINRKLRKTYTSKQIKLEYEVGLLKSILDTNKKLKTNNQWATDIDVVNEKKSIVLAELGFDNENRVKEEYMRDSIALSSINNKITELILEKKQMEDDIKRLSQLYKFGLKNEIDKDFVVNTILKYSK